MGQFERTALLIGDEGIAALRKKAVAVFGVGGVGSFAVEALARAGVGRIALFDHDTVAESNLNRQLIALHSTIGQLKVEVAARRIHDICPQTEVLIYPVFYTAENADEFDLSAYDYVIDAIDTVTSKLLLIERCKASSVPILSSMGTGNHADASHFAIADISKTSVCPLARVMRTELKKRGIRKVKVLFSDEPPLKPRVTDPEKRKQTPGSLPYVPSVAGLLIAGEVVRDLLKGENS